MNILLLTTVYGNGRPHSPLIESLAATFVRYGHSVRVAVVNWDASPGSPMEHYDDDGVEVVRVAPVAPQGFGKLGRLLGKWLLSSRAAVPMIDRVFGDREYDLFVSMTPAVTLSALIDWALSRSRRSYAYVTDFFPFQHANAGLFPIPGMLMLAKIAETHWLRKFDRLGTMSPLGVDFLRTRFSLLPGQPIEVLRLWADDETAPRRERAEVRASFDLPLEATLVIFGGQITHGRGVEDMLAAAKLIAEDLPHVVLLFVGSGSLAPLVEQHIVDGATNVLLRPPTPNDAYLDLVSACDVGLVATIATHGTPTFPSKTIDYLKAGLPVIASTDIETDYNEFIEEREFGLAITAGNPGALAQALKRIAGDPSVAEEMRIKSRQTFEQVFSASRAADQLLAETQRRSE